MSNKTKHKPGVPQVSSKISVKVFGGIDPVRALGLVYLTLPTATVPSKWTERKNRKGEVWRQPCALTVFERQVSDTFNIVVTCEQKRPDGTLFFNVYPEK